MKRSLLAIGLMIVVLAFVACRAGRAEPTSPPSGQTFVTVTPSPTGGPTLILPTATPLPTLTPLVAATATPTPMPVPPTATSPPTVTPSPPPPPGIQPERIQFPSGGTSARVNGAVPAGSFRRYVVRALAGQTMSVNLFASGGVRLVTFGENGVILVADNANATTWQGELPATQDYFIDVKSTASGPTSYTLDVIIPAVAPTPTPSPERIQFPAGGTSARLSGTVWPGMTRRYVIRIGGGQTLTADLFAGPEARLVIFGADGTVYLPASANATTWQGRLPLTQDYFLDVRSSAQATMSYTLDVTVPPAPPATPEAERLQFPPGGTVVQVPGTTGPGTPKRYVLRALAGQRMIVDLFDETGSVLSISGANGVVLLDEGTGLATWQGILPATQDYFIDVINTSRRSDFSLLVNIPTR